MIRVWYWSESQKISHTSAFRVMGCPISVVWRLLITFDAGLSSSGLCYQLKVWKSQFNPYCWWDGNVPGELYINTMAVDDLAPFVTRPSAAMYYLHRIMRSLSVTERFPQPPHHDKWIYKTLCIFCFMFLQKTIRTLWVKKNQLCNIDHNLLHH